MVRTSTFPSSPQKGDIAVVALFLHKLFNFGNPSIGPPEAARRCLFYVISHGCVPITVTDVIAADT
jgi:hypothetical protein